MASFHRQQLRAIIVSMYSDSADCGLLNNEFGLQNCPAPLPCWLPSPGHLRELGRKHWPLKIWLGTDVGRINCEAAAFVCSSGAPWPVPSGADRRKHVQSARPTGPQQGRIRGKEGRYEILLGRGSERAERVGRVVLRSREGKSGS